MTMQSFFDQWNNKFADYDHVYGNQCKDLFSFYNRDVVGNLAYVPGDAWKLYEACPAEFYSKVGTPRKGDVAIWKKEFGGYGHVAIVWDNGQFFSQNYPLKAPCSLRTIPTNLILGYLRPKLPMTKNDVIDIFSATIHKNPNEGDLAQWTGKDPLDCIRAIMTKEIWLMQKEYVRTARNTYGAEKL